eukprot:jgi/Mesen1/6915/ME000356S06116
MHAISFSGPSLLSNRSCSPSPSTSYDTKKECCHVTCRPSVVLRNLQSLSINGDRGFSTAHISGQRRVNSRVSASSIVQALSIEEAMQSSSDAAKRLEWADLEADLSYMTRTVRLVQWYPGHIAKAERALKEQLKWVDIVLEVRDARIPMASTHPDIDSWIGERKKLVVLNREDMVTAADRSAWASHYSKEGTSVCYTDGQRGSGIMKLNRAAALVGKEVNKRRHAKGLLPRAVRAAVVGYPNVGKSAIINRLLKRRAVDSAPRPGVTRHVKWTKIGEGLELLDAPGVLPPRIDDQAAAARAAICNDIGEAAYAVSGVAVVLIEILKRLPTAGPEVLTKRYKLSPEGVSGDMYLEMLADHLVMGDVDQAAHRVLKDFRKGAFGWVALERPPVQP